MSRLALLFLPLALLLPPAAAALPPSLDVALGMVRPGAPSGGLAEYNESLGRELCQRIARPCRFHHVLYGDILDGITRGRFQIGFGNHLRTPERERQAAFSQPIWQSSSRLVARAGPSAADLPPETPAGLDALRHQRLVCVTGSQQCRHLRAIAAAQQLTVIEVSTMGEVFDTLRADEAGFALTPMLSAYAVMRESDTPTFRFVGPPLAENGLGGSVHIALSRDDPALREAVDRALTAMRRDGTLARINRRHFPFSLD